MKKYLGFITGIFVGGLVVLCGQALLKAPDVEAEISEQKLKGGGSLESVRLKQQLGDARERISRLEDELVAVAPDAGGGADAEMPVEGESGASKAASFIELMQSFGDRAAQDKIAGEVDALEQMLGLSESQAELVRSALEERKAEQAAAGVRMVAGASTIQDLASADEDNYSLADAAITEILDGGQLAAYEEIQAERELERVERKTEEELAKLMTNGDFTDEQQVAAWKVLEQIIAGEKPSTVPEGTTAGDFFTYLDQSLDNRVNRLTPILTDDQLGSYRDGVEDFRTNLTNLINHATGAKKTP